MIAVRWPSLREQTGALIIFYDCLKIRNLNKSVLKPCEGFPRPPCPSTISKYSQSLFYNHVLNYVLIILFMKNIRDIIDCSSNVSSGKTVGRSAFQKWRARWSLLCSNRGPSKHRSILRWPNLREPTRLNNDLILNIID